MAVPGPVRTSSSLSAAESMWEGTYNLPREEELQFEGAVVRLRETALAGGSAGASRAPGRENPRRRAEPHSVAQHAAVGAGAPGRHHWTFRSFQYLGQ